MTLQLTLRSRLVLLMVAALLPLCGLSMVKAWLGADAAVERALTDLRFAASLAAASQQRATEAVQQVLVAVMKASDIQENHKERCERYLAELKRALPHYANLGIVGVDGYVRCHALGSDTSSYLGDRAYFREAVARRGFVVGEYVMGRLSGKPTITFALPAFDESGSVSFVAYAGLDLRTLSQTVAAIRMAPGATLGIYDRAATLLAGSAGLPLQPGQKMTSPPLAQAASTLSAGVLDGNDARGQRRLWAFMPSSALADTAFFVAVSMDHDLVVDPIRRQLWLELAALALLALLGGGLAWVLSGRAIVRPTALILTAVRQLESGRFDVRIAQRPGKARADEFSQIAAGLNRMAEALQHQQQALAAELVRNQAVQEQLQDAQRLARIGYWETDLASGLIWWSDEIYALFELDRSLFDVTYGSFVQLIHPLDREVFKEKRAAALRAGTSLDIEFRVVTPSGKVCWIKEFGSIHPQGDAATPRRFAGVVQDITERKNAELAITSSTELLNHTGRLAKVGGWELSAQTLALSWSEEVYRIHELEPAAPMAFEEALGFYDGPAQSVLRDAIRAALEQASDWDLTLPLTTAKGRQLWVRTQGRALLQDGKVVRLVGALQDITEQQASQEHLRLLETCISRLNDMVMITEAVPMEEPGPRIVFVNDAFERHTGYASQEVLGRSPRFLQGPETQRSELDRIAGALKKWQPIRVELINYTKSGRQLWVELDIVPIANEKGWVTHWVAVQRNITQRKLAEQALVESEQRYAALFDTAPVPMWVYDTSTLRYLAVNQATVQAYGYSAEEFQAMTVFDIRPESEHAHLKQWLANPARKTALWHDLRKDGSRLAVETVSQPIRYADREARLVVAVDKTDQQKAEKDVQDYLFTLQRAADAAQAITWHQTLESTMQEVAEQARGVIGAHQAVVSLNGGSHPLQTIRAVSLSEKYEPLRGVLEQAQDCAIQTAVCKNNRPVRLTQDELDAHRRWRDNGEAADPHPAMRGLLAVPLIERDGKNIGMLQLSNKYEGEFTQQDEYVALELGHLASAALENSRLLEEVSQLNAGLEQKVAERTAALAHQEALFRALAEQAPQTVWTASPEGAATYYNRAWFDLVGGESSDWTGYKWLAVAHPEDVDEIKANWSVARTSKSAYAGIRRLMGQDGRYHTMAYRCSPVLNSQGEVSFWVGIDADITEIKAIEAALRLSNQELEAFSYSVSHDLRSPLNTVDGFSRLLAKQLAPQLSGEPGRKAAHYLARIQAGVAQMGQLIEDLLSLSQVARAQLRTETVDLSLMARGYLEDWQARQPQRQVKVHIEPGLQARADGRLVRVALENLLANAWKFTSQTAHAEIHVGQKFDAAGLPVFFVKDNGAGFDMAYADKLFDPFQRLHAAAEFSGTGIGLATVSRVIKRHDGQVWAKSSPGGGATFFFTLLP